MFQSFHWFQTFGTLGFLNSAACNISVPVESRDGKESEI
jgi:hypothetical protein